MLAETETVLADSAVDHGDRRRGLVVIVEAGVLVVAPADHPGVDVLVVADLLVDADVGGVPDRVAPALGRRGEVGDEPLELDWGEAHTATVVDSARRFPGLVWRRRVALAWRVCSQPVRAGSTTGRSEPYTS